MTLSRTASELEVMRKATSSLLDGDRREGGYRQIMNEAQGGIQMFWRHGRDGVGLTESQTETRDGEELPGHFRTAPQGCLWFPQRTMVSLEGFRERKSFPVARYQILPNKGVTNIK